MNIKRITSFCLLLVGLPCLWGAPVQAVPVPATPVPVSVAEAAATAPTIAPTIAPATAPAAAAAIALPGAPAADDPTPPAQTVKLIFIHHSTGRYWLADKIGGLGLALRDNNYFVSDTDYEWGPDQIGSTTDIGHWWSWFRGPQSATYLQAVYTEFDQMPTSSFYAYSRLASDPDPSRENQIVMFKSCYPNSQLKGNPTDPPTTGDNPLRGQAYSSQYHTVANVKGIYNDLLVYFSAHQDKLFVVITAPPLASASTTPAYAANARAFNNWLVNDWLDGYAYKNVAVFNYYNVLTSNGGDSNTNDLGQATGNHHRWYNGALQHVQDVDNNFSSYPTGASDSHPTQAGQLKATGEFVQALNVFYHRWANDTPTPTPRTLTVNVTGSGSVTRSPDQATYVDGDVVTLTAIPAAGWSFTGWGGNLSGSTNPITITMDGDKSVTASFSHLPRTLTVHVSGSGSVTHTPDQATYFDGDVITLTATPEPGWYFMGWSGGLSSIANPGAITIDGNKTVTATFSSACAPITAVDFTFTPVPATIGQPATFTAQITGGTVPIYYNWDIANGLSNIVNLTSSLVYSFPRVSTFQTYPVKLTTSNGCSSLSAQKNILVRPFVLYLPFGEH